MIMAFRSVTNYVETDHQPQVQADWLGYMTNISSMQRLEITAIYLTVSTNVMVTALIVFYILRERRSISSLQVKPLY